MSAQAAGGMQVERVLDDLITRLSSREGPEARAALIEARRLRNVTTRWAAIPPPPDARREMLARVMDLVAKVGGPKLDSMAPESGSARAQAADRGASTAAPPKRARSEAAPRASHDDDLPPLSPKPKGSGARVNPAATRMGYDAFDAKPQAAEPASDSSRSPTTARSRGSVPAVLQAPRTPTPTPAPPTSAPPTPPPDSLDAFDSGPPPRRATPHRGPTMAGIPEAMETRGDRPSAIPTLAPPPEPEPPPSRRAPHPPSPEQLSPKLPRLGSIAPPPGSGATVSRSETLSLGAEARGQVASLVDEILGAKPKPISAPPPPTKPRDDADPHADLPPVLGYGGPRRQTNPLGVALDEPPPSQRERGDAAATMAPSARSSTPIEGLSTSVSSPRIAAQSDRGERKSSPTQALFTPIPAPASERVRRSASPTQALFSPPALDAKRRSEHPTQALFTPTPPPVGVKTRPASGVGLDSPAPPRATPGARPAVPAADRTARTMLAPGIMVVHPDSAAWQPHSVLAGVTVKVLFREPRSGMCTWLVRLAPGASLPRRRHAASEELLVISGVASIGATEIRAGEYCRAEIDTVHEPIGTTSGCTLFVSGSEHDEYLDEG